MSEDVHNSDPFNLDYLRSMLACKDEEYYRPAPLMTRDECERQSRQLFNEADIALAHIMGVDLTR